MKRISVIFTLIFTLSIVFGQIAERNASAKPWKYIYKHHCLSCHGSKGQGTLAGPNIKKLTLKKFRAAFKVGTGAMQSYYYIPKSKITSIWKFVSNK